MRIGILLAAGLFSWASASAAENASLSGRVVTGDGVALPQVLVTLRGSAGTSRSVSGPDGRFHLSLPVGEYEVATDTPGLTPTLRRLTLTGGHQGVEVRLVPGPIHERVVVSATRNEAAPSSLGVSTSVIDRRQIEERAAPALLDLLRELPGVDAARAGGVGAQSSLFVRGGESRFARVLVDGVPLNQPGGLYDMGAVLPFELERVEIVKGAASSLYGTDSLAGVIQLVTRRGEGGARFRAAAEGGSFDWRRGEAGASGRSGPVDFSFGAQHLDTDNETVNNHFSETEGALSVGVALGASASARLVLRAFDAELGTPGQVAYGRPDRDARFDRSDLVGGLELRAARGNAAHLLRAGFATTHQLSRNPEDSGPYLPRNGERVGTFMVFDAPSPAGFQNDTGRSSFGYQVEIRAHSRHLLTLGGDLEHETGALGSRAETLLKPSRTNIGGYLQDRMVIGNRAYLTLGGRAERNDSYGTRFVPRAALAVRLREGDAATTLRTSAGAGINEPDFFQSFGASFFAKGNPNLKPERSRTYDLGLEQRLFGSRLRASATAFHHDYLDQIAYQILDYTSFEGSYVNLGHTRARGLELAVEAAPVRSLSLAAEYTLLDGEILESGNTFDPVYARGQSLLRRPRHSGSFSASGRHGRFSGGLSLVFVGRRADSDFLGIGLTENEGYARLDARFRLELTRGLSASVACENLTDREYQEALGYPALGRSVRAGLHLSSGR